MRRFCSNCFSQKVFPSHLSIIQKNEGQKVTGRKKWVNHYHAKFDFGTEENWNMVEMEKNIFIMNNLIQFWHGTTTQKLSTLHIYCHLYCEMIEK